MLAIDSETTGVDLRHGARPFLVTTCDDAGRQVWWEWHVDPMTRLPEAPEEDIDAIALLLADGADNLILHNTKFDVAALASIRPAFGEYWRWKDTEDTLLAAHLLASNRPKDLTSLAVLYLGIDIQPYEDRLGVAVQKARTWCRTYRPDWRIAREGEEGMPSVKSGSSRDSDKPWRNDLWLPRVVAREMEIPEEGHEHSHWWTVCREYANVDSAVTAALWKTMENEVRRRGLIPHYEMRKKLLPIAYSMESRGVTINQPRTSSLVERYEGEEAKAARICLNIAQSMDYPLELPKPASVNNSLRRFCFGEATIRCPVCKREQRIDYPRDKVAGLQRFVDKGTPCVKCKEDGTLPPGKPQLDYKPYLNLEYLTNPKAKTEAPTLDAKVAIPFYLTTLDRRSKAYHFIRNIALRRSLGTALQALRSYEKFWSPWIPVNVDPETGAGWYVLYPNLNPTGTDTLRWSSFNPNSQNISKKDRNELLDYDLVSTRWCFGPAPGREWWSFDARGIEDRLPAYKSGQQELIEIFEHPDQPPYYGSNHFLRFHTVYPDLWDAMVKEVGLEKAGPTIKKRYGATNYQWVKNGGFAVQYGAVEKGDGWGTADRAFHKQWSHKLLKKRFSKLEELNQACIRQANKYGYIETMPDKTVDPKRGYPLLCTRTESGRILETVPLNYYIQGTAMWWTGKAMIRVQEFFDSLNRGERFAGRTWPGGYYIALQVHDELVPDMPSGEGKTTKGPADAREAFRYNLPIAREVKRLMELGGTDINIPTPVSMEYNPVSWAEGISV